MQLTSIGSLNYQSNGLRVRVRVSVHEREIGTQRCNVTFGPHADILALFLQVTMLQYDIQP